MNFQELCDYAEQLLPLGLEIKSQVYTNPKNGYTAQIQGEAYWFGAVVLHIAPGSDETEAAMCLAHELGHYLSWQTKSREELASLRVAYSDLAENMRDTKAANARLIVKHEEEAWDEAARLLKLFGFTGWVHFHTSRDICLGAYMRLAMRAETQRAA